ncbi:hypothetical protein BT96DRAFT_186840 [Gymnopus androsaceus JB14]|uniref:Uncharacterized protein n=1 Tax=Gymnopus androsaceus JB14 TaxID=1447944 RepID=A0A6A4H8B7_9AGAR|nr:hypothetical protein BT96DRAFT_186840 [Gymnopus androsaceus JB14]
MLPHFLDLKLYVQSWSGGNREPLEGQGSGVSKEDWIRWLGEEHKKAIVDAIRLANWPSDVLRVQVHDVENFTNKSSPLLEYVYRKSVTPSF